MNESNIAFDGKTVSCKMYMRSTVQSNWLENLYVCNRGQSSKDCISAEQVHIRNFSKKLEDILD